MKRVAGYIRTIPDADPELGIAVSVRLENGGSLVPVGGMTMCGTNPVNTDAVTGYFEWECELSPGPIKIEATATSGQVKRRSGTEQMQTGEVFYSDVPDMLRVFSNGPLIDTLSDFDSTATGLNVTVQPGMAIIDGRLFSTATNRVIAQGANVSLAIRKDILVLQQYVDGADVGKQAIALKVGTVNNVDATYNTDPNITEVAIYRVALANGGATPTLTDLRVYATVYPGQLTIPHSSLTGVDTDTATTAIHHTLGTGANQASQGTHAHASLYSPLAHTHSYAPLVHDHDLVYSLLAHNHSGVYSPTAHTHDFSATFAPIVHAHTGNATLEQSSTMGYGSIHTISGSDTDLTDKTIGLADGVTYDIIMIAISQGSVSAGATTLAYLGVKYEGDTTVWGASTGDDSQYRTLVASDIKSGVVGTGANVTITMKGRKLGGSGNALFESGQLIVLAIPRTT